MISAADFVDTIRSFIQMITEDAPPSPRQLARALDEIAMLVHETPAGEPADPDLEPPRKDYRALCNELRTRFPDLGHYVTADPFDEPSAPSTTGDAIDDLSDIISDLSEVVWRYDNAGFQEAFWYFHLHFQIHWGRHLRELSRYLQALLTADDGWDVTDTAAG